MYRQKNDSQQPVLFDIPPEVDSESTPYADLSSEYSAPSVNEKPRKSVFTPAEKTIERKVKKVVVFFDDGTFQEIAR